jgi:hypothetical protein
MASQALGRRNAALLQSNQLDLGFQSLPPFVKRFLL